jgi:hypothetical protein
LISSNHHIATLKERTFEKVLKDICSKFECWKGSRLWADTKREFLKMRW